MSSSEFVPFFFLCLFDNDYPNWSESIALCGFDLNFLMISGIWSFFGYLLYLERCMFSSLAEFLIS